MRMIQVPIGKKEKNQWNFIFASSEKSRRHLQGNQCRAYIDAIHMPSYGHTNTSVVFSVGQRKMVPSFDFSLCVRIRDVYVCVVRALWLCKCIYGLWGSRSTKTTDNRIFVFFCKPIFTKTTQFYLKITTHHRNVQLAQPIWLYKHYFRVPTSLMIQDFCKHTKFIDMPSQTHKRISYSLTIPLKQYGRARFKFTTRYTNAQ